MSLYECKLLAPIVFELLNFKRYWNRGALQKSTKSPIEFFCWIYINDNSKLNTHAKFHVNVGSTSGSMTRLIFDLEFQW